MARRPLQVAAFMLGLIIIAASASLLYFSGERIYERLGLHEHIALYYEEKDRMLTVPVMLHNADGPVWTARTIPFPLLADELHLAAEAILLPLNDEEKEKGLVSCIPEGTRLIGIAESNGFTAADFTAELAKADRRAFDAIESTLSGFTGNKVIILIEGLVTQW